MRHIHLLDPAPDVIVKAMRTGRQLRGRWTAVVVFDWGYVQGVLVSLDTPLGPQTIRLWPTIEIRAA